MAELKRTLPLYLLVFYGLGTILGAGIYVLTGVVATHAGYQTPLAFLLAALVASPTAFSYAELSARFPRSAGEVVYVSEAFDKRWLSTLMGFCVVLVGIVSAATISRGFVGYLEVFVQVPAWLVITTLLLILGGLAIWGVMESVAAAALITLAELGGLLVVVFGGFPDLVAFDWSAVPLLPTFSLASVSGVLAGAFLAFYAFIGFEDIVNVAEETLEPERTLPRAIVWSLVISTALYVLVALVAVASVPLEKLAGHEAPIALIVGEHGLVPPRLIAMVSILAIVNGALVQIVMASRVIYGMARLEVVPGWLGLVSTRTNTPVRATVVVVAVILVLALGFNVETLAGWTSAVTLLIFAGVNTALIVIKRRAGLGAPAFSVPVAVPVAGLMTACLLFAALFVA